MIDIDQTIAKRIKKLMALAEDGGANEHEAALAQAKAQELMFLHNITIASLNSVGSDRESDEIDGRATFAWQRDMMAEVVRCNFCVADAQWSEFKGEQFGVGYRVIGRTENIIAVRNTFDYLIKTIERLALEFTGGTRKGNAYESFRAGMGTRLSERLSDRHYELMAARRKAEAAQTGGGGNGTSLVIIADYEQAERDANYEVLYNLPRGSLAANRARNKVINDVKRQVLAKFERHTITEEASFIRLVDELVYNLNLSDELIAAILKEAAGWFEAWTAPKPALLTAKELAEREREWRRQDRIWEQDKRRKDARIDRAAWAEGERAGHTVGLDDQIDKSQVAGALT